jgi:glycosyltransferase involved in cell wall biosynthesis
MKPKILVITPRYPYPVIGGDRLRIYHICRELAKKYDLTLLSLCETKEELKSPLPNDGIFVQVERVLLPKWKSWLNCLMSLPTLTPLQVAYYRSSTFQKKLTALIPNHDLLLAHLIRMAEYIRYQPLPKVLEMTDAISLNYSRVKNVKRASDFKALVYKLEQHRLFKYEKEITQDFDLSVLVSPVDRDFLFKDTEAPAGHVIVCSNGVDIGHLPYQFSHGSRRIVMIGNMTTVQNMDAARYFASEVMPVIIRKYPDAVFEIVGRIGRRQKEELCIYRGVKVVGSVDSISEATRGAAVGVCPVQIGAGVQNKVLEYMALGLPVVTTRIGLEGIEATIGKEVLVADTSDDMAAAISVFFDNREYAEKLAQAARIYVEENHTWSSRLREMLDSINCIIDNSNNENVTYERNCAKGLHCGTGV